MSKVLVLQHMAYETPGLLGEALEARGVELETVRVFAGDAVPTTLGGAAGLVVMGGPMGVNEADRYPTLRDEVRLVERALAAGAPIFGICLGSQIVATALGARVSRAPRFEVGWREITLADAAAEDRLLAGSPRALTVFHWHGDMFALPEGAVALASSEITPVQAFRHGDRAYAFQFHLEATPAIVEGMIGDFEHELEEGGTSVADVRRGFEAHLPTARRAAERVFGRWGELR